MRRYNRRQIFRSRRTQSSGSTKPDFNSRQLESTDYLTYIKNLRAAGCPEQTVRDIITTDVNATFAARHAEITAKGHTGYKFWETGTTPENVRLELGRQKESVDAEMQQVVRELLGPDAVAPSMAYDWHEAELNQELSLLPTDKRDAGLRC